MNNTIFFATPQAQPEIRHRHGIRELRGKRAVFRNGRMAVPPYEVEQDAGSNPVCPAINKKNIQLWKHLH